MVDFLLYAASLLASVATRSKMSVRWESGAYFEKGRKGELTINERVQNGHGAV